MMANPTQFNRADGAGYTFAAEMIKLLDPLNPQVAARLATAFRAWRTMETGRRVVAEDALRQIKALPGLSRDVGDIVERALG
jgi:aminopeptidase N